MTRARRHSCQSVATLRWLRESGRSMKPYERIYKPWNFLALGKARGEEARNKEIFFQNLNAINKRLLASTGELGFKDSKYPRRHLSGPINI